MVYLLKVNIAIVLFYAFYKLLLSKDTFFVWRRVALLAIMVVSPVLPLVQIGEWLGNMAGLDAVAAFYHSGAVMPELVVRPGNATGDDVGWMGYTVTMIYCIVAGILLLRLLVQLSSILALLRGSHKRRLYGTMIRVLVKDIAPFSFFKLIFINTESHGEAELHEIISHERAHVEQWHSVDVLLSELACIVLWYNPFMWLVKQEIRNNLEYLADNKVIVEGHERKTYQYHLLGLTYQKAAANLYNNFNVLPLKERIKMMNKKRTRGIGKAKYLLFLPMVAALLIGCNMDGAKAENTGREAVIEQDTARAVSSAKVDYAEVAAENGEPLKVVEKMPEYPGGEKAMLEYLKKNIAYPQKAHEENIQGTVIVRFVVQKDGSIGDIQIIKKVHPLLDAEAERLVKGMAKFEPGMQGNKPVDVYYTIPIVFSLTSAE